jgi:hypothetical protein
MYNNATRSRKQKVAIGNWVGGALEEMCCRYLGRYRSALEKYNLTTIIVFVSFHPRDQMALLGIRKSSIIAATAIA